MVRLLLQKEQSKRPSAEEIHNNLIPQLLGDLQNLEECNVSASSMIDKYVIITTVHDIQCPLNIVSAKFAVSFFITVTVISVQFCTLLKEFLKI